MLNFDFLEKGLGIVSPPHFMRDISRKMFPMLQYILLTDQISLADCLFFLRYWIIYVLQFFVQSGSDVTNFEINLIFLIKLCFYLTKK